MSVKAARRWGLWVGAGLLSALLLLLAAALRQGREPAAPLPLQRIGAPWPAVPLPLLGQADVAPQTLPADGQPRIVNLWASWCGPCRAEHPLLLALAAELRAQGRADRLVGLNYRDAPADAQAFLATLGNPFAMTLADADGRLAVELGAYGAPETYVVDAQGRIAYRHIGALTPEVIARELRPRLGMAP